MAKIISMSLDSDMLEEIDSIVKSGFSGRSEVIRSGMKLLIDDMKLKERLKGHIECVLVLVHRNMSERVFLKTKHQYEDIINTQIHSNFCDGKCLEVFVLHGHASKIIGLFSDLRKNKKTEYIKLIVP